MLYLACEPMNDNNQLLRSFLRAEIGENPDEATLKEYARRIFPDYLIAEQEDKCVQTIRELYDWTAEPAPRVPSPFHKLGLFGFFMLWKDRIEADPEVFRENYFDEEALAVVKKEAAQIDAELGSEGAEEYYYTSMDFYVETLLYDLDFLLPTQWLSVSEPAHIVESMKQVGLDVFEYYELFPEEARQLYGEAPFDPWLEMPRFLRYCEYVARYGGWTRFLWTGDRPASIAQIGSAADELAHRYFSDRALQTETEPSSPDSLRIEIEPEDGEGCSLDIRLALGDALSEEQTRLLESALRMGDAEPEEEEDQAPDFLALLCFSDGTLADASRLLEDAQEAAEPGDWGAVCVVDCRRPGEES